VSSDRIFLLPIDRYRVDYEVGYGTPFSTFDLIVLGTIAEDETRGVVQLARILCLPQRILVESIVALARAGWIAVGGRDREFEVTHAGHLAVESLDPPRPEHIEARQGSVVMDRLTGQIATLQDVNYWTTKRLQDTRVDGRSIWERAERLERNPHLPLLDSGRAKPFLRRASEHSGWIRWVANPIPQLEAWLKLSVGPGGDISGLPDAWRSTLGPTLSELLALPTPPPVASREGGAGSIQAIASKSSWSATSEQLVLVTGGGAHWDLLKRAFAEATSQLLIASAFASPEAIERDLRPLVISAVGRGVRVDLMWGYSKGQAEDERVVRSLKSLRSACSNGNLLRFNELPSGSHAKLLLWDSSKGGFHCCVGSNNWLSVAAADYGSGHLEVSIDLKHSGVAAYLSTTVAGLWSRTEAPLAGASDLWHRTASDLEKLSIGQGIDGRLDNFSPSCDAVASQWANLTVVRDQEHEAVIRALFLAASRRIGVSSHKLGPKGPIRLASIKYGPLVAGGIKELRVIVGSRSEDGVSFAAAADLVVGMGGALTVRMGVHAKLVVADDTVLVTSFNPLSADPFGTAENAREVGLLIQSKSIADAAWGWLRELEMVADA